MYVTNLSADESVEVDAVGATVLYVGKAAAGTAGGAASWKIFKMITNAEGDLSKRYADGNTNYDNVWDNRTALSYP